MFAMVNNVASLILQFDSWSNNLEINQILRSDPHFEVKAGTVKKLVAKFSKLQQGTDGELAAIENREFDRNLVTSENTETEYQFDELYKKVTSELSESDTMKCNEDDKQKHLQFGWYQENFTKEDEVEVNELSPAFKCTSKMPIGKPILEEQIESNCCRDMFGFNNLDEDPEDNFVIETCNEMGKELVVTLHHFSQRVINTNEVNVDNLNDTCDSINSAVNSSDLQKNQLLPLDNSPVQEGQRNVETKINSVIDEMIKTEESYVRGLEIVAKKYLPLLKSQSPQLLENFSNIFGDIEEMKEEATQFLDKLKANSNTVDGVAEVFIDSVPIFEIYFKYSENKLTLDRFIKEFQQVLMEQQTNCEDDVDLDCLLSPIKRLVSYKTALKKIKTELEGVLRSLKKVNVAIHITHQIMKKYNNSVAQNFIKNCCIDLNRQGSCRLIDNFTVRAPRSFQSKVFLFDQTIIFTQGVDESTEFVNYVDSVHISDLTLEKTNEECILRLINSNESSSENFEEVTYVLEADSPEIKDEWSQAIEDMLREHLKQDHQNELTTDLGNVHEIATILCLGVIFLSILYELYYALF